MIQMMKLKANQVNLQSDKSAEIQFQTSDKHHEIWIKMKNQYQNLFKLLFVYKISFGSNYFCKRSFSNILPLENTKIYKLDFENIYDVFFLKDLQIYKCLLKNCNQYYYIIYYMIFYIRIF